MALSLPSNPHSSQRCARQAGVIAPPPPRALAHGIDLRCRVKKYIWEVARGGQESAGLWTLLVLPHGSTAAVRFRLILSRGVVGQSTMEL